MESIVEKIKAIIEDKMAKLNGSVHSFRHVERVFKIATHLALQEEADLELVQIGALLHDVGWTIGRPHHETGAELAGKILEEINYPKTRREKIVNIVLHHHLDSIDKLETLEEKVVWDADKIDILGILGVVRAFHLLGDKPFELVVQRAFREMKAIYPLLNTKTARTIAEKRHRETIDLLDSLKEELSLADLQLP